MSDSHPNSRLPGFYRLPLEERQAELARQAGLSSEDLALCASGGIVATDADRMVENAIGIVREQEREGVENEAKRRVEDKLLELLVPAQRRGVHG